MCCTGAGCAVYASYCGQKDEENSLWNDLFQKVSCTWEAEMVVVAR